MCETCTALGAAIDAGTIGVSELPGWRRAFAADPDAAAGLLADREPDQRRRIRNRVAVVAPAWSESENRDYMSSAASRLGITSEELV